MMFSFLIHVVLVMGSCCLMLSPVVVLVTSSFFFLTHLGYGDVVWVFVRVSVLSDIVQGCIRMLI